MNEFIVSFFENRAKAILGECHARADDLNHFKQVLYRINQGEDLSSELPQLKKLDKKAAIAAVKTLIKRCEEDMVAFWLLSNSPKIKVDVKHTFPSTDLVPRFIANYIFTTPAGKIGIRVVTQGNYISVQTNTKDITKPKLEEATRSIERQLALVQIGN
jgi:hypothetical protein